MPPTWSAGGTTLHGEGLTQMCILDSGCGVETRLHWGVRREAWRLVETLAETRGRDGDEDRRTSVRDAKAAECWAVLDDNARQDLQTGIKNDSACT